MKYLLVLSFLLLSCCKDNNKVTAKDIKMATCICQKYQSELSVVKRYRGYIDFRCVNEKTLSHYDDAYTVGCSSL